MEYLHDLLLQEFGKREIANTEIPRSIIENLTDKFPLRDYQSEAFKRFMLCLKEDFKGKPSQPFHFLFNMATGSGKTYIMAGLILYLYELGFRDFIFFVNSRNIIQKTKDNFTNSGSSKFLFNDKIEINGKSVFINEVKNFDESEEENINIKFTTIQQLHIDLTDSKENSLTFEEFSDKKIVLIADEAHHLSSSTSGSLFDSWENTVLKLLKSNYENILLEFTATIDYESRVIADKYKDKVIFKYDLSEFRNDKFSKEINLIRSNFNEKNRIILALILNIYRQEIAAIYGINLKPVILFKSKKTIKESEENKQKFHDLIDNLSVTDLAEIKKTNLKILQQAFSFFNLNNIDDNNLVSKIKYCFVFENCLSANNDEEAELNQILLNSLEDEDNPIRAIFAVQKLNEGWDVLNLFDIVRLYEDRDSRAGKPGKTTISEAQLIGRGARYFPFKLNDQQEKYTRKYDSDLDNHLRPLEELYYHTIEDSRYISELKKALVDTGIYEDEDLFVKKDLVLKDSFKKTNFYTDGKVFFNERIKKDYCTFSDLNSLACKKKNVEIYLDNSQSTSLSIFDEENNPSISRNKSIDVAIKDFPKHVLYFALSSNSFYDFSNLKILFPILNSIDEFINSENFLSSFEVTYISDEERLNYLTNKDYLYGANSLLIIIKDEIAGNIYEYTNSDFTHDYFHNIFKDKSLNINKLSERLDGQEDQIANYDWYPFNANYGTSEEKSFLNMFARKFESLKTKFDDIYLIRNERELKIFDKIGRAFEPDFLLFCKTKDQDSEMYQVFIEPKGSHLIANDKWKEDLLINLRNEKKCFHLDFGKYLITGVPFYNNLNENEFSETLFQTLNIH